MKAGMHVLRIIPSNLSVFARNYDGARAGDACTTGVGHESFGDSEP
jgi:hypothetical protein